MADVPAAFLAECTRLNDLVSTLSDAELDAPTGFKKWTINAILQHLHWGNIAADMALVRHQLFI